MLRIIRDREHREDISHELVFASKVHRGCAYAFACNEAGEVLTAQLQPLAVLNLEKARTSPDYYPARVRILRHRYTIPAAGICECGATVELDGWTNTCECGRDYDSGGGLLAPRYCWGEETGEHYADLARL